MPPTPSDAWTRLGRLLVQRRIELAPRYRERTVFADDVGIKWRLLHDIERAKRDSFSAETLAAVEVAYRWRPGSVARVLAGGDPVPIPATPASRNGNGPEAQLPGAGPGERREFPRQRPADPGGYTRERYGDPALEALAREFDYYPRFDALRHADVERLIQVAEDAALRAQIAEDPALRARLAEDIMRRDRPPERDRNGPPLQAPA